MTRTVRADLILPPAVAVAVGTAALLAFGLQTVGHGDAVDYMAAADAILAGEPYPRDVPSRFFFRPPGYPALIAALWWVFGVSVAPLKVANIVALAATATLLALLATHASGDRRVGLVAGSVYALHPFALRYVVDVQTEPVFTALLTVGVTGAYLAMVSDHRPWLPAAVGGLGFGIAALTRPSALGVVLVIAAAIWAFRGLRNGLPVAAVVLVAVTVTIAPWTWTNWRATGDLIPVADGLGHHMWIGNHPDILRTYEERFASPEAHDRFHYPHLLVDLPTAQVERWREQGIDYEERSVGERDRLWRDDAVSRMVDRPALTARLWAWKTWGLWQPWLRADHYPTTWVIASGLGVLGLYGAATVGGLALWRRSERGRAFVVLTIALAAASTAVHVATHVLLRFRLPYVDPYLTVLAAVTLVAVGRRMSRPAR